MNEFETKITNITTDLADTLIAKNHDYGNAFHDSVKEFGNVVMAIRIGDKYKRLKTLLDSDAQVDESIEDTLRDLAGYAILSLIEMNDQKVLAEQNKQIDENTKKVAEQYQQLKSNFPLPK